LQALCRDEKSGQHPSQQPTFTNTSNEGTHTHLEHRYDGYERSTKDTGFVLYDADSNGKKK
jgi:hypothetical protein